MDPILLAEKTEDVVCDGIMRKYWRIRPAMFYGGIATCDVVGCNLRCIYCWSWDKVTYPEKHGRLYAPDDVGRKLIEIAKRRGFEKVRVSGGEPTIGKRHLLSLIEYIEEESDLLFILETNGLLIDEEYARELSKFRNLYVRVSLKGSDAKTFSAVSGADERFFGLQLRALKNLNKYGVECRAALMKEFVKEENLSLLRRNLRSISQELETVEFENLILYPRIRKRLEEWLKFHKEFSYIL